MDNVFDLHQRLEHYKKVNPMNAWDYESVGSVRHTYCHLMMFIPETEAMRKEHIGWHKIEVRSWHTTMDYRMTEIGAVCWTLAAGSCTLVIKDDNLHRFKILEDEPTLQVLYG